MNSGSDPSGGRGRSHLGDAEKRGWEAHGKPRHGCGRKRAGLLAGLALLRFVRGLLTRRAVYRVTTRVAAATGPENRRLVQARSSPSDGLEFEAHVALGAIGAQAYAPTTVYVAERRYVRRHRCGCVVHGTNGLYF